MASRGLNAIAIAASIVCIMAERPVQLDERHLQQPDQEAGNGWQDSVPGLPGKDYPNLTSIPETSFSCTGKTPGGYYADVETRCQVFHVCNTQGLKSSFLCPSGSVFNQRHFVCDWWYDFECEQALELYSLNDGLDEPESDRQPPNPPLQINSLSGSGANSDLFLASSGYPNNIRDEANLIYEDYATVRPHDAAARPSTEKAPSGADSSSSGSGASALDNYFGVGRGIHRTESYGRFNGLESNYQRPRDREDEQHPLPPTKYRRRPSQGPDNVPRGFSKPHVEEQTLVKKSDFRGKGQGPSIFINSGLSDELNRRENLPLPRENNNYVDTNNYNNNFNSKDNNHNNNNNDNQNYYQHSESNPLPQENNNYVNNNNNYINNSNNYIKNNIRNNDQNNNYYNKIILEGNVPPNSNNNNNNNIRYDNYYDNAENMQQSSYEGNFDLPKNPREDNNYVDSSTPIPRSVNSSPTEDDIDRERQREVDSADLKKERAQPRQYDHSHSFLIREETTNTWRYDLSTSSTGSENSPPYPPVKIYLSPDTSSPSKPEESTTPVAKQQQSKYLGKRPAGGLPGGAGNGLPGVNKILAGSDSITGKPSEDPDSNRIGNVSAWDDPQSSYLPPQNYQTEDHGYDTEGQSWNNGGQWNDGARY